MPKRTFYRNVITITILSEEPLEGENSLSTIEYLITDGGCSGEVEITIGNEAVDGATLAKLLREQRSDPSFFDLDNDGNDLDGENSQDMEDEHCSKFNTEKEALPPPYTYMVSLTNHQLLYQEVIVASETPLSEKETIERALALAGDEWEPGPIDEAPDVDQVQILCTKPVEQKEPSVILTPT